jgi:ABC-type Zn uptake system ZnuABC Zn-binding protein ZnuA
MPVIKSTANRGLFHKGLVMVLLSFLFWGTTVFASPKRRIVCTFFPLYIFTKNVVGNQPGLSVELLLPPELGCPHDYALTPGDVKKIFMADLVIVNGLGMETFLSSPEWERIKKVKIVEAAKGGEAIHFHTGDEQDKHHILFNPHLFASPRRAEVYIRNIEKSLSLADPSNRIYKKNAGEFIARLEKLGLDLKEVVKGAPNKKVVLFHESLEYLLLDAGLDIINIVKPERELSVRETIRLIQQIKKSRPVAIFSDSQYRVKVAKMISDETGVSHFMLDSLASGAGFQPGYYESVMQKNIQTIRRALGN